MLTQTLQNRSAVCVTLHFAFNFINLFFNFVYLVYLFMHALAYLHTLIDEEQDTWDWIWVTVVRILINIRLKKEKSQPRCRQTT